MATRSEMQLSALKDYNNNLSNYTSQTAVMLQNLALCGYVRTGRYTGSGRYTKAVDNTDGVVSALKRLQISHAEGNDSPRGGVSGNYVVLTSEAMMKLVGKSDEYRRLRKQVGRVWKYVARRPYTHDELLAAAREKIDWVTSEYCDDENGRYWLNVYHGAGVYELIIRDGRIIGSVCGGFHPTIPRADNRISPEREAWIEALGEAVRERVGGGWQFVKADGSGTAFFLRSWPEDTELQRNVKEYTVPSMDFRDHGYRVNYEIRGEK